MKKILLCLFVFAASLCARSVFADVQCALGQTCQVPISSYGEIQAVTFEIPSPWSDPIGQYSCQYVSSDASVEMDVSPAATRISEENLPAINSLQPGESLPLQANAPTSFAMVWSHPGKPHSGVIMIQLLVYNSSYQHVDPNTQLYASCKKV